MQVIIIKDGTVPVAVAKVTNTDGDVNVGKHISDNLDEDNTSYLHDVFEVFTVPDARYIGVTWADGDGFDVLTYQSLDEALGALNAFASPEQVAGSNIDGRHWAVTYGEDDPDTESYGHVFDLES